MRRNFSYLIFVALLLSCSVVCAQQTQQPRDPEEYAKRLEAEQRVAQLQVDKVIETLKLKPGQRVADIGAGSGLFTRPVAKRLGAKGVIYAIDIDEGLLKIIERTAKEQSLTNIQTVVATTDDPKIPQRVDLIMIVDTLHHIQNQAPYLKNLKRYLRPGGRIAVIDFQGTWPEGHESMIFTLEQLDAWMKDARFKRIEKHDFLERNFFVVYR